MLNKFFRRLRAKPATWRIPVLCYHSWTVQTGEYAGNDHIALETDLKILAQRGYAILPATHLAAVLAGQHSASTLNDRKLACITFDDGIDLDWHTRPGGNGEPQKSFAQILREARIERYGKGPLATAFVIASAEARSQLDSRAWRGQNEWNDDWWAQAAKENIIGIANHSWDHVHTQLDQVQQKDNRKGSFLDIDTFEDAEKQVAAAHAEINRLCENHILPLFGYPFGHIAPYLQQHYLPTQGARIGLHAAFSTCGRAATPNDSRWAIPRLVCGWHWHTTDEFNRMLDIIEQGNHLCSTG
ncbi:MAG: hypothetical protein GXZ05_08765 [Gammaproteobacteria bacterium]|nr:hypothetical protein [Gammaproteobacteria bacterium]